MKAKSNIETGRFKKILFAVTIIASSFFCCIINLNQNESMSPWIRDLIVTSSIVFYFNEAEQDVLFSAGEDSFHNVFFCGKTTRYKKPYKGLLVHYNLKNDENKVMMIPSGKGISDFRATASTEDGGCLLCGWHTDTTENMTGQEALAVRIDGNGKELWSQGYSNSLHTNRGSCFRSIKKSSDNSFILCGSVLNDSVTRLDSSAIYMKINGMGEPVWTKIYDYRRKNSVFKTVTVTNNKEIFLTGSYFDYGKEIGFAISIDSSGKVLWERDYGSIIINTVIERTDGGFVLGGKEEGLGATILMTDASGVCMGKVSMRQDFGIESYVNAVCETKFGFIIGVNVAKAEFEGCDGYAVVTDASGDVKWCKLYMKTRINDLKILSNGNYCFAGCVYGNREPPNTWAWISEAVPIGNER
ncbi:MAG: hypothetical protein JW795_10130 [Chitinivibrionales bacterium]|nr:hypothetical protein [Chitinivibrionales bacterium]